VACKALGYVRALSITTGSKYGPVGEGFSYNNVKCVGTETSLDNCPHNNTINVGCTYKKAAGVVCTNNP
jgi:lysyl oxidase-like protein 2/3/4